MYKSASARLCMNGGVFYTDQANEIIIDTQLQHPIPSQNLLLDSLLRCNDLVQRDMRYAHLVAGASKMPMNMIWTARNQDELVNDTDLARLKDLTWNEFIQKRYLPAITGGSSLASTASSMLEIVREMNLQRRRFQIMGLHEQVEASEIQLVLHLCQAQILRPNTNSASAYRSLANRFRRHDRFYEAFALAVGAFVCSSAPFTLGAATTRYERDLQYEYKKHTTALFVYVLQQHPGAVGEAVAYDEDYVLRISRLIVVWPSDGPGGWGGGGLMDTGGTDGGGGGLGSMRHSFPGPASPSEKSKDKELILNAVATAQTQAEKAERMASRAEREMRREVRDANDANRQNMGEARDALSAEILAVSGTVDGLRQGIRAEQAGRVALETRLREELNGLMINWLTAGRPGGEGGPTPFETMKAAVEADLKVHIEGLIATERRANAQAIATGLAEGTRALEAATDRITRVSAEMDELRAANARALVALGQATADVTRQTTAAVDPLKQEIAAFRLGNIQTAANIAALQITNGQIATAYAAHQLLLDHITDHLRRMAGILPAAANPGMPAAGIPNLDGLGAWAAEVRRRQEQQEANLTEMNRLCGIEERKTIAMQTRITSVEEGLGQSVSKVTQNAAEILRQSGILAAHAADIEAANALSRAAQLESSANATGLADIKLTVADISQNVDTLITTDTVQERNIEIVQEFLGFELNQGTQLFEVPEGDDLDARMDARILEQIDEVEAHFKLYANVRGEAERNAIMDGGAFPQRWVRQVREIAATEAREVLIPVTPRPMDPVRPVSGNKRQAYELDEGGDAAAGGPAARTMAIDARGSDSPRAAKIQRPISPPAAAGPALPADFERRLRAVERFMREETDAGVDTLYAREPAPADASYLPPPP